MSERHQNIAIGGAALVVFVAIRLALLIGRDPFFDELFTVWLVRQPFGAILDALRHDSGPPLYYVVLKLAGVQSVVAARVVSLVCATIAAALLIATPQLGRMRFAAVLLLAVEPASVLFSTDARAYALCALFVTAGIVAIVRERPLLAACSFVAAAYSHYYGVFFFAMLPRWRAVLLAIVLFIPGLLLARAQPAEATRWIGSIATPLEGLPFAGRYPESLFKAAPWALVIAALVVLLLAVAREWRMARFALIPFALVFAITLAGRPVYFPMRFESVIAVPLVLWISASVPRWPRVMAIAIVTALVAIGAVVSIRGVVDHYERPMDDYRAAAIAARNTEGRVVASGYLYLEAVSALGDRVEAFPREQGVHPGWRATLPPDELRRELPPAPFVWIGERAAPELSVLCASLRCRALYANRRAMVVAMD